MLQTHCCGHIVAHDVSWAAQTGKHLLRTQNVSEQNPKHFLCPGHKICVRNKCCARGQTGKHLCRQQCAMCPHLLGPYESDLYIALCTICLSVIVSLQVVFGDTSVPSSARYEVGFLLERGAKSYHYSAHHMSKLACSYLSTLSHIFL